MDSTTDETKRVAADAGGAESRAESGSDMPGWKRRFHAVRRWFEHHSYAIAGWGMFLFIVVDRWTHDADPHEMIYLLGSRRMADPRFLGSDFTWAPLPPTTFVFDHLFAPLWSVLGESGIIAIGRIVTWGLLGWSIAALARAVRLPAWCAFAGFALWMLWGQTLTVCGSLVEGFQVKSFSYPLLFFGLAFAIRGKAAWAGLFMGIATAFHIIVGGWALLALTLTMLVSRRQFTLRQVAVLLLTATPFVAPLVLDVLLFHGAHVSRAQQAQMDEIYVRFAMPHCCDPPYFMSPIRKLRVAVTFLLALVVLFAWPYRRAARILGVFTATMILFFVLGEVASGARLDGFLKLYPLQMSAALAPLFFFMFLFGSLVHRPRSRGGLIVGAFVLLGTCWLMVERKVITNLVEMPQDFFLEMLEYKWPIPAAHEPLYGWIREHTPRNSVFITPFLYDFWPYAERAQIASMRHPPLDRRILEWKERLEALNQFQPYAKRGFGIRADLEVSESLLSKEHLIRIRERYGATHYLVAGERRDLARQLLHSANGYSVYDLRGLEPDAPR